MQTRGSPADPGWDGDSETGWPCAQGAPAVWMPSLQRRYSSHCPRAAATHRQVCEALPALGVAVPVRVVTRGPVQGLPPDVVVLLLSFLSPAGLRLASHVCRQWLDLIESTVSLDIVMKTQYLKDQCYDECYNVGGMSAYGIDTDFCFVDPPPTVALRSDGWKALHSGRPSRVNNNPRRSRWPVLRRGTCTCCGQSLTRDKSNPWGDNRGDWVCWARGCLGHAAGEAAADRRQCAQDAAWRSGSPRRWSDPGPRAAGHPYPDAAQRSACGALLRPLPARGQPGGAAVAAPVPTTTAVWPARRLDPLGAAAAAAGSAATAEETPLRSPPRLQLSPLHPPVQPPGLSSLVLPSAPGLDQEFQVSSPSSSPSCGDSQGA
eukprot:Hpha_TRINITY_DN13396_c0_g1::TRINITY_DN13396_c0_g1_i1::g.95271::m.95271